MTARALFLDRDGVINVDHGYVFRVKDFQLQSGIIDLLSAAQSLGFLLIVVTNQSGIARGMFAEDDYVVLERHIHEVLESQGVRLTGVYHCPHHPAGTIPEFAVACECRKPSPGMILRAAADHGVDLARSIMVGDKQSDIEAARTAGIGKIYLVHRGSVSADFARIKAALAAA